MAWTRPRILDRLAFYESAQEYLRDLRENHPEHFMESVTQSTQRKITIASLELVHTRRPEVQLFNELLVQYRVGRDQTIRRVCPDNMVVVHGEPIKAEGSFDVPLQPAKPLWVLEYVSSSNSRKDYDDNMQKYDVELKLPYYLLFTPDAEELTLFRRGRTKFASIIPNVRGRLELPELELEMALVENWVRFWFRGELLPLPGELLLRLDEVEESLATTQDRLEQSETTLAATRGRLEQSEATIATTQADLASAQDEIARLRDELRRSREAGT